MQGVGCGAHGGGGAGAGAALDRSELCQRAPITEMVRGDAAAAVVVLQRCLGVATAPVLHNASGLAGQARQADAFARLSLLPLPKRPITRLRRRAARLPSSELHLAVP